jgi:hypothetical protein
MTVVGACFFRRIDRLPVALMRRCQRAALKPPNIDPELIAVGLQPVEKGLKAFPWRK